MKTRDITKIAILTSICVVISILESLFTFIGDIVPGLKLGLANIVIIFALYEYDFKTAFLVSIIRVLIVALIRTGFGINFFFSLSGAIFSIIFMYIFKKTRLSIIGVSIIGSVFHSIGQVLVGMLLLDNYNVIYYLPYLLLFSIPTGIVIGIISKKMIDTAGRYV